MVVVSALDFVFVATLNRGGGLDVITSYHHFRVKELFPDNVIFLLNSFSREGSSVAASSSSFRMSRFIPLITSRNVSMEVREFKVSSVGESGILAAYSRADWCCHG